MSQVVGLPNNSCNPITNAVWVRARFFELQKKYTRLAAASNKVYQLLVHDRWFSPGTPASSTTKPGRHDIVELLLKVALSTNNQSINLSLCVLYMFLAFQISYSIGSTDYVINDISVAIFIVLYFYIKLIFIYKHILEIS